jgi:hypothetical protein
VLSKKYLPNLRIQPIFPYTHVFFYAPLPKQTQKNKKMDEMGKIVSFFLDKSGAQKENYSIKAVVRSAFSSKERKGFGEE